MSHEDDLALLNRLKNIDQVDFVNRYNVPLSIIVQFDHLHMVHRTEDADAELLQSVPDNLIGLQRLCKSMDRVRKCHKCMELFYCDDFTACYCISCALKLAIYRNSRPDDLEECLICSEKIGTEDMIKVLCCNKSMCCYCAYRLADEKCPFCNRKGC